MISNNAAALLLYPIVVDLSEAQEGALTRICITSWIMLETKLYSRICDLSGDFALQVSCDGKLFW